MSNHSLVSIAWAIRSAYGFFLIALLYYFHNRTVEQERIYHAVTGAQPLVLPAVEKVNQWYFQKTEEEAESYPSDQAGKSLGIAASVWERATAFSTYLSGISELPSKEQRTRAFQKAVSDLIAMRDTLIVACNEEPGCDHHLKEIVPATDDAQWNVLSRLDATDQTNILQLQTALATGVAMRYLYHTVRVGEICGSWRGSPSIMSLQIFPAAGDWYEAVILLNEYACFPAGYRFKINGLPYPEKEGCVHYQHRFARPGKHRLQVEIDVLAADSTVFATSVKNFEINVLPRPLDSPILKSN